MKKVASYNIAIITIIIFTMWLILREFSLLVLFVSFLNLYGVCFALQNIRLRISVLMFNITIFLFLTCRPLIDLIMSNEWYAYDEQTGSFALIAIAISIISIIIGVIIYESIDRKKEIEGKSTILNSKFIMNIQMISLLMFMVCLLFNLIMGIEKVYFTRGSSYLEYYASFETRLPVFVKGISTMRHASLAIYLATMPKKKNTIIALSGYVSSTLPDLMVGSRGPISEALIFIFLYYFLRDNYNTSLEKKGVNISEKWITRKLKTIVVVSLPIIIIFFSSYNYSRFGTEKDNEMNPFVDFMYKQGITFTMLSRGYEAIPNLPNRESKNYTFGPYIDYITRGTPAQILFGAESLGASNSLERATEGNNFNASLSYYLYGNMYFQGYGTGSSYIIELYADYGFIGISIFSVLLGMLLSSFNKIFIRGYVLRVVLIRGLMDVFIIPRFSVLSWTTFILSPQFWLPIMFCWIVANLLNSNKTSEKY